MIVCRTLGPVDVSVNGSGAPPELLWRKNLALLVYLARSPKRARTREHLIGLLWADKPEKDARHSLNEAVRRLRHYAGDSGLDSDSSQVRVAPGAVELDTDWFEARVAAGDYAGAAQLAHGPFLEGFSVRGASEFETWLAAERQFWRQRCVDVLIKYAEQLLTEGRVAAARDAAARALDDFDATSDAAVRSVMRCLALEGDRGGALAVFEDFAARLQRELGTAPDAETKALAERVRRERRWQLPEAVQRGGPGATESRRAPLEGRATELTRLLDCWAACRRERRLAVAIIVGDGGTGKSRLAEELVARARLDGAAPATVRAVEADTTDAWSGVLGLARAGLLAAPGVAGAAPEALALLRSEGATPQPLGRAFSEAVRAIAEEQPVVLLVDDAHWLDRESQLALGAAARDLAGAPVLMLLTAAAQPPRTELDELRVRIGRELPGAVVRLDALRTEALRDLARWFLPRYDDDQIDRVTRRVAADSAGIPLLAVELLHAVAGGYELQESSGAWPQPFRTLDQSLPGDLPDPIVAAIRVGFHRLSAGAQRVLAVAAVLDGRVPGPRLGRGAGLEGDALAAALDELEWQRWLTAEPRGYAFVARIVRDVVERDMVTAGQRERMLAAAGPPG